MVSIGSGVLLVSMWFLCRNMRSTTYVRNIAFILVIISSTALATYIQKYGMILLSKIVCSFSYEVLFQQLLDFKVCEEV